MTIYQNAIDSIEIGVEDFRSETDLSRRYLSAIRNIYAGILLLCKHKLCTLSPGYDPELLIKKSLVPYREKDGSVIFKGEGKSTVDMQLIQKRFQSLDITIDFKKLKKIQSLRNNIEHYYTTESTSKINELISYSFLLIKDFLSNELDKTPSKEFTSQCWSFFLDRNEVHESEKKRCIATLEAIDWEHNSLLEVVKETSCPRCDSELIDAPDDGTDGQFPDINLRCNSCRHEFKFSHIFDEEIRDRHDREDYNPNGILVYCEKCHRKSYLTTEMQCILCSYQPQLECTQCGIELSSDEADCDNLCSACYSD